MIPGDSNLSRKHTQENTDMAQKDATPPGDKRPHHDSRALLRIAVPLAGAYLAEVAMGITDMVIVGRLGANELAAVGLTSGLAWDFIFVCYGVLSIVGVLSAQAYGANDHDLVGRMVSQGFWVAVLLAIAAKIFIWNLANLLSLTGQDPDIVRLAHEYLWPLGWCVIPTMGFIVLRNLVTALARATVITAILVPSIFLNLFINYTLVFGKFGFPAMGVAGAGWGSTIVCWFLLFSLLGYILWDKKLSQYDIRPRLSDIDFGICKTILRVGTPVGGFTIIEVGMFSVVALLMGTFGAVYLAAGEVLLTFTESALVLAYAVGEAAGIRIAFFVGRKTPDRGIKTVRLAFWIGLSTMLIGAVLTYTNPNLLAAIFLDVHDPENEQVLDIILELAGLAALFLVFDGWQLIAGHALKGMQDTIAPMWFASVGYWVFGLGGGALLCFGVGLGPVGLWWGVAIGLAVIAVSLTLRLVQQMRLVSVPLP